jgi:MFS family permease
VTEITAERSEARRRLPGAADFWRLWLIGLIVFTVRWIEMLVFAVFAYQVTGSAFIVTMLTMLRMLPLALFGAFMGAVADRFDRRRALLVMPVILFAISIAAMMLAGAGRLEIWHLAVLAFVNGVAWASDNTIRRVMIGDVVGGEGMATAMALDTGANNASRMLGPALGGALFAAWGAAAPFAASAGLYAVAIGLAIGLHHRNHVAVKPALSMFGLITEGLRAVRHSRKLSGIFAVTAIFNIFNWPFLSLIPVVGKDTFNLEPQGIGVLSSMGGVGAMLGAMALVLVAQPARYPAIFVGGVILFQAMQIAFALTRNPGWRACS